MKTCKTVGQDSALISNYADAVIGPRLKLRT